MPRLGFDRCWRVLTRIWVAPGVMVLMLHMLGLFRLPSKVAGGHCWRLPFR